MDTDEWQGLTVRARDRRIVGVVAGVFADGPHAGRLRVQGECAAGHHHPWLWTGSVVLAIPRQAVVGRTRGSLVLDVTLGTARARWCVHVLPRKAA
jgi:hypothetical protein